jgi:glutaminyl-tRNA synthetase
MSEINMNEVESKKNLNFIEAIVEKDLAEGKNGGRVQTRFPPERIPSHRSRKSYLFGLWHR